MGLLDLPSWVFSWTDATLAGLLPAGARIVLWGSVGAVVSLGLYWLVSPQQRMARIAAAERGLKRTMWDENAAIDEGFAAARELVRLALARLGLVLVPVLIAALPVLSLAAWLHTQYGFALPPPGQVASVKAEPHTAQVRWVAAGAAPARVEVLDGQGFILQSVPVLVPVPIIHKRAWWNVLIGNPLGYLPNDSPVDGIEIGLPKQQYLSVGPDWIRGWEALFFAALLAGSLLLKSVLRIR
ncbi:MAG: hypothetical protein GEU91_05775 [Rhizobiales bacterium]|nr:hypothetical protein [Hyphomicrobiales bacterium]